MLFFCFLYMLISLVSISIADLNPYYEAKKSFIQEDDTYELGFTTKLQNDQELLANEKVAKIKNKELIIGYIDEAQLLTSKHFFKAKDKIEKSNVFQIIKKFPKAAQLHGHSSALLSTKKLFGLINKFEENLYLCYDNGKLKTKYFSRPDESCDWLLLKQWRIKNDTFDYHLKSKLSLVVENPEEAYKTQKDVWEKFEDIFVALGGFLAYKPVFEAYWKAVLQEFYDDNVMYLEIRTGMGGLYDLQGKFYDRPEVAGFLKEIVEEFKKTHENFYDLRVIISTNRNSDSLSVRKKAQLAVDLAKKYPNFIVGFDLVGHEDGGKPLTEHVDIFLEYAPKIKYFFHAGETNWSGNDVDENLYDAIILNATRIGHGYAAFKHPEILRKIKENQIPLEICPISNQVLKLVNDLRNHPANVYISQSAPMVIASDDPSFWGASGLSYDWYYAFMAMSSTKADLRFLETLAINSIAASALSAEEKYDFYSKWRIQWNKFIKEMAQTIIY